MSDVFISYARQDASIAEAIAKALTRSGFSVFFDRMIIAGEEFSKRIQEEMQSARVVIFVLSRHAQKSRWVQQELTTALASDRTREVLPVLIDHEAEENPLWPLIADRRSIREFDIAKLPNAVADAVSSRLARNPTRPIQDERIARKQRIRLLLLKSAAVFILILLVGLAQLYHYLNQPRPEIVNFKPVQRPAPPSTPKVPPNTALIPSCRLPSHGVEYWMKSQQWTADSDWQEKSAAAKFCANQLEKRVEQYPDRIIRLMSVAVKQKTTYIPFKSDLYRFTCLFEDKWEPVYKLAPDAQCSRQ
jgi:hypothetical protein